MSKLERVRPEDVGISPSDILKWLEALNQTGFITHHLMLLRYGKVAFEVHYSPFRSDVKHYLCSCSKSFTAIATGFAIAEGLTFLDEHIVDIFPDKLDGQPHEYIAAMTVRHLLVMSTVYGDVHEPETNDWTHEFLNGVPDHYPGTVFGYDSIGTHVLCDIIQLRSKKTVQEFLTPRLFKPLGIDDDDIFWKFNPGGVNHGGGGLSLTPEAMAKFGQLLLNDGKWNGKQILPAGWVDEATSGHVSCITCDGTYKDFYGYKFWRTQDNGYACLGLAGQVILVHPDKEIVFVGAANGFQTDYHYFHKTYFWQYIYPKINDKSITYENENYKKLIEKTRFPEVFLPAGKKTSPMAKQVSGQIYSVNENKLLCNKFWLDLNEKEGTLHLKLKKQTIKIPFGFGYHKIGDTALNDFALKTTQAGEAYPNGSGAAGVWVDERTLVIQSHVIDTLQYFIITCHFGEKAVVLQIRPYGVYSFDVFPCSLTYMI